MKTLFVARKYKGGLAVSLKQCTTCVARIVACKNGNVCICEDVYIHKNKDGNMVIYKDVCIHLCKDGSIVLYKKDYIHICEDGNI